MRWAVPIAYDYPWKLKGPKETPKSPTPHEVGTREAHAADPIEDNDDERISFEMQNARNKTVKAATRFGLERGRLDCLMADVCLKMPSS
eukprot:9165261-Pyramimonas_sp.AAC.1